MTKTTIEVITEGDKICLYVDGTLYHYNKNDNLARCGSEATLDVFKAIFSESLNHH
jgi:hypothetical protein